MDIICSNIRREYMVGCLMGSIRDIRSIAGIFFKYPREYYY